MDINKLNHVTEVTQVPDTNQNVQGDGSFKFTLASAITPKKKNGAMHECAVCHRTELDDPELEFRYCSKCDGNYEYCQDHLFTHKHVKR